MLKLADKESSGTKRLVLGFDAGCFTCSDLAERIEERVGEKIEVRSLRDPQVEEWRRSALGEDAPWAPTLVEVEGAKVRAWTGWQLGVNLSRFLGPVATWRIMQALGEVGALPKADESPPARVAAGVTRGQFLKGMGGAALAMSVLSGGSTLFPSIANAESSGSLSERTTAVRIAQNSALNEGLEERLERITDNPAASFNFDSDNVRVVGSTAVVAAFAEHGKFGKIGAVVEFFIDMRRERVIYYLYKESVGSRSKGFRISTYDNGKYGTQITLKDDYAILPDGRRVNRRQLKREIEKLENSSRTAQENSDFTAQDYCSDCISFNEDLCNYTWTANCTLLGVGHLLLGAGCSFLTVYANSQGAGCVGYGNSTCVEECS